MIRNNSAFCRLFLVLAPLLVLTCCQNDQDNSHDPLPPVTKESRPWTRNWWMDMLRFTIEEAGKHGMGVDINLGTGWPYGGPQITPEFAAKRLIIERYPANEGECFGPGNEPELPLPDQQAEWAKIIPVTPAGYKRHLPEALA